MKCTRALLSFTSGRCDIVLRFACSLKAHLPLQSAWPGACGRYPSIMNGCRGTEDITQTAGTRSGARASALQAAPAHVFETCIRHSPQRFHLGVFRGHQARKQAWGVWRQVYAEEAPHQGRYPVCSLGRGHIPRVLAGSQRLVDPNKQLILVRPGMLRTSHCSQTHL